MIDTMGPVADPEVAEAWLARPVRIEPRSHVERSKPYVYGQSDPKVVAKVNAAYVMYLRGEE